MAKLKSAILYSSHAEGIKPLLKAAGIRELPNVRSSKPEYIITYGGDGTFLTAEREWPGVPKIVLRHSRLNGNAGSVARLVKKILSALKEKEHEIKEYPKVVLRIGLTEGIASNDIILRNWNPNQALRFAFEKTRGSRYPKGEIIGDGLVLATPIGESAYFRSITRQGFSGNFGLAFNNPTKPIEPIDLGDDFSFVVRIVRETGILSLDNLPSFWLLREGDVIEFHKHTGVTRIVELRQYYPQPARDELSF